jgi:hypothetical protein
MQLRVCRAYEATSLAFEPRPSNEVTLDAVRCVNFYAWLPKRLRQRLGVIDENDVSIRLGTANPIQLRVGVLMERSVATKSKSDAPWQSPSQRQRDLAALDIDAIWLTEECMALHNLAENDAVREIVMDLNSRLTWTWLMKSLVKTAQHYVFGLWI